MTTLREAASLALERLERTIAYSNEEMAKINDAKHALRQALAQPEHEPVGWLVIGNAWDIFTDKAEAYRYALTIDGEVAPVYTASQSTKAAPTKAKEKT